MESPRATRYRGAYPDKWSSSSASSDEDPRPAPHRQRRRRRDGHPVRSLIQPGTSPSIFKDPETRFRNSRSRHLGSTRTSVLLASTSRRSERQAPPGHGRRPRPRGDPHQRRWRLRRRLADGVIKPNIGQDYAQTGLWDYVLRQGVPNTGDPELAKKLITDSGEAAPTLTFDFRETARPTTRRPRSSSTRSARLASLSSRTRSRARAVLRDRVRPQQGHDFGTAGWGADWPNASTVIPPLFTAGRLEPVARQRQDLERQDRRGVRRARSRQAGHDWQDLNKYATEHVCAIPTFFGKSQTIAGNGVGVAIDGAPGAMYRWAAYGSWPYAELYVK